MVKCWSDTVQMTMTFELSQILKVISLISEGLGYFNAIYSTGTAYSYSIYSAYA